VQRNLLPPVLAAGGVKVLTHVCLSTPYLVSPRRLFPKEIEKGAQKTSRSMLSDGQLAKTLIPRSIKIVTEDVEGLEGPQSSPRRSLGGAYHDFPCRTEPSSRVARCKSRDEERKGLPRAPVL
jgi:hypothetical protein